MSGCSTDRNVLVDPVTADVKPTVSRTLDVSARWAVIQVRASTTVDHTGPRSSDGALSRRRRLLGIHGREATCGVISSHSSRHDRTSRSAPERGMSGRFLALSALGVLKQHQVASNLPSKRPQIRASSTPSSLHRARRLRRDLTWFRTLPWPRSTGLMIGFEGSLVRVVVRPAGLTKRLLREAGSESSR